MKILFDQNVSFRILKKVEASFPDCAHVNTLGLIDKSDKEIWNFAKENNYAVVTFDSDFYDFSVIWGVAT